MHDEPNNRETGLCECGCGEKTSISPRANMAVAQHPSRLVNQPFQKELKLRITNQARTVRDMVAA